MKTTTNWNKENDSNWRNLAIAIVIQAVKDYELAFMKNQKDGLNGMNALRRFFCSPWCETLVSFTIDTDCLYDFSKGEFADAVHKFISKRYEGEEYENHKNA